MIGQPHFAQGTQVGCSRCVVRRLHSCPTDGTDSSTQKVKCLSQHTEYSTDSRVGRKVANFHMNRKNGCVFKLRSENVLNKTAIKRQAWSQILPPKDTCTIDDYFWLPGSQHGFNRRADDRKLSYAPSPS